MVHMLMIGFFQLLVVSFISSSPSPFVIATEYNVLNYGAKPDGVTDSGDAFVAAWNQACASLQPATIIVPHGIFFIKNVTFSGPCKNTAILVSMNGTLIAPSDYLTNANVENWISFKFVDGVNVTGGILDGQGSNLWKCKSFVGNRCPDGATLLRFSASKNVEVRGLTSQNSPMFKIAITGCINIKLEDVHVSSPGNSPNTDGIHIQSSTNVTILNPTIGTGDDCISIGPNTHNLWIENISCGPGHGVSVGSLGKNLLEPGVQNVTVNIGTFNSTQNGVRIKSWGRKSNGFARDIHFRHVVMTNVSNPIIIDQNYCPHNVNCPDQDSGVKISDVTYEDIHGTSASKFAVSFNCSVKAPCSGIRMANIKLTYNNNEQADAICNNAIGTSSGVIQPPSCLKAIGSLK